MSDTTLKTHPPLSGPSVRLIPEGDNRERLTCPDCGYIAYENPKLVVGAVVTWQDKILLCRRAIEPALGKWTVPAGFMEMGETVAEGAAREVMEEACADVTIGDLLGIYNVPHIGHVLMFYRATMNSQNYGIGEESLETRLFDWADIPWNDLAFESVSWALKLFKECQGQTVIAPKSHQSSQRFPR